MDGPGPSLTARTLGGFAWTLAAAAVQTLLALPELPPVLRTLAPVAMVVGLGIVSEYLLRRDLRFRRLAVAGIASRIAGSGVAALALALLGFGVWALVGGRGGARGAVHRGRARQPAAALSMAAGPAREAGLPPAATLALALAAWAAGAAAAAYWAPPFARPRFARWLLEQAPFERAGRPGRLARAVLGHLARRWHAGENAPVKSRPGGTIRGGMRWHVRRRPRDIPPGSRVPQIPSRPPHRLPCSRSPDTAVCGNPEHAQSFDDPLCAHSSRSHSLSRTSVRLFAEEEFITR